jgi:Fic family protein
MTDALGRIKAALGITTALPLLPAQEDELRHSATVGTIHYSTLIEGNTLSTIEAERALRGVLEADTHAKIELINYVETLAWLDRRHVTGEIEYSEAFLLEMHGLLTKGLGREDDDHFKPHHEGAYRDGEAFVVDRIQSVIMHTGAPQEDVQIQMQAMFDYLDDRRQRPVEFPAAILAGLAHHRITDIHPFADGNGRTARTFAMAVLMREGALPKRIFSFERPYAENKDTYFAKLRTVTPHLPNYTEWLEYYLAGLADEYETVAERVRLINEATTAAATQTQISTVQEQLITRLSEAPSTTARLAKDTDKSAKQVQTALKGLADLGVVTVEKAGRTPLYRLTRETSGERRGRPVEWTEERIAAALLAVTHDMGGFPTLSQLEESNYALFRVVRRRGGLREWRRRLGY